jgi:hypothetical protein
MPCSTFIVIAKETLVKERDETSPDALLLLYSLAAYSTKKGSLTATYLVVEKAPSQRKLAQTP